jgi:hypothetical protein
MVTQHDQEDTLLVTDYNKHNYVSEITKKTVCCDGSSLHSANVVLF